MSRVFLRRWIAILSLSLIVAGACDSGEPARPSPRSIDGNWQGQLSDTSYLLVIRVSPTGEASGHGVEFRLETGSSTFEVTGTYGEPEFLLHFSGPTYPTDFMGTLQPNDTIVGAFRVNEPSGQRTRAGVVFSRLPVF